MKHDSIIVRYQIDEDYLTVRDINKCVENAKVMVGAHTYVDAEVRALSTMRYEILVTFVPQEPEMYKVKFN